MIDKLLNRIYSIDNHPIASLDMKYRIKYVKGLGACLYLVSGDSPIVPMLYTPWARSILNGAIDPIEYWCNDVAAIKSAISVQHKGIFHFFSMKYCFFYDVLYLLRYSFMLEYDEHVVYNKLKEDVCGFWTKRALREVYDYFNSNSYSKGIHESLIKHRQLNEDCFAKREKRVLVVANVSAGKSTLINAIVGTKINKTQTTACTNKLVKLHNKCSKDGLTIKRANGTYCFYDSINEVNSDYFVDAAFPFNSLLGTNRICFIDTPGINNAEDECHRKITEDAIVKGEYDVVMYVSNCQYFGANDEYSLLKCLKTNVQKTIIFVLNQLDQFVPGEDSIGKMLNDYKSDLLKFGFTNPTIIPVSAYAAFLFKSDSSVLSKSEIRKKKSLEELFDEEYYDFPSYVGERKSSDKLSMTGIHLLENKLNSVQ